MKFKQVRLPFIDTLDKAHEAVRKINEAFEKEGARPIVFSTLVKTDLAKVILPQRHAHGSDPDFRFPAGAGTGREIHPHIGRSHNVADTEEYKNRIEAINFSLAHDDGQSDKNLSTADVILVGVSRSGKTPTSLYLAMQYGIKAANYPLIPEDFERKNACLFASL
jgi:regulator of PEP synthase PpsR (kinase-PPPase family)